MDSKNPQDGLGDSATSKIQTDREAPVSPQISVSLIGTEALEIRRADLKQAADEIRHGHYDDAKKTLDKLLSSLEQSATGGARSSESETAKATLLQASALTALGQVHEQIGEAPAAQAAFERAANLFGRWLAQVTNPTAQDFRDYGVALLQLGRKGDALKAFETAATLGSVDAVVYRNLARAAQDKGEHAQARELLLKTIEAEPGEAQNYLALAESLAALGQHDQEVMAYRAAATAFITNRRINEAMDAIGHALELVPDDPPTLLFRAELLRAQARDDEALQTIEQALLLEPTNAYTLGTKGRLLRALDRPDEAVQALQAAAQLDGSLDWVHAELGAALNTLKRPDEAARALDAALKLSPDNAFALGLKGRLLNALEKYDEALPLLQRALELDPTLDWLYPDLCTDLILAGRSEEALPIIEQAQSRSSQNEALLVGLKGEALRSLGRHKEAVAAFERSLELQPDIPYFLARLGQSLLHAGRGKDAIEPLQRAVAKDSTMDWPFAYLGWALNSNGRYEEALQALDQALQINPDSALALRLKGEALRAAGRQQEALPALDRSLALEPENAYALGTKGQVLRSLRQPQEALPVLQKAYELDQSNWILEELCYTLTELNEHKQALGVLDLVLTQRPNDAFVLQVRGEVLRLAERYDEALLALDRSLELEPNNIFALDRKGEVLRQMQRYDEALLALDRSLELEPDNTFALGTKGQVLHALDRSAEALPCVRRALDLNPNLSWARAELGEVYLALDRYEDALRELGEVLKHSFDASWAITHAGVLCDIGEYEDAVKAIDSAIERDNSVSWFYGIKGFALENCGPARAADSRAAYEAALLRDPEVALWPAMIGNALYLEGRVGDAAAKYEEALERADKLTDVDAELCSLKGWCKFRLEKYEKAVRLFMDALSLNPLALSDQFNLALALLCSDRVGLALREYEKGVEQTQKKPPLRQRGLLYVARNDLTLAIETSRTPACESTQQALSTLSAALEKAQQEISDSAARGRAGDAAQPTTGGNSGSETASGNL
jgi:tetratricopeptide (TPR) repeat protein